MASSSISLGVQWDMAVKGSWSSRARRITEYRKNRFFQLLGMLGFHLDQTLKASMLSGIHLELAGADGAPVVHDTQLGWNKDGQQTQVGGFALTCGGGCRISGWQDGKLEDSVTYDELGRRKDAVYHMDGTVMYRESDSYNVRGLLSGKTVQRGRTWKATSTPMTATDGLLELVNTDAAGTPWTERYTFDENRKRLGQRNGRSLRIPRPLAKCRGGGIRL
ncbi:hypothetical protein SAMN05216191_103314 [Paenibacillus jilunlii]|uniref:YD repeat-containing protein n=3 Tax=Paenibacillus jilunlii TaxID=682956 RepID=A0A1G9KM09_9BACL|nr:hypothetical protein SAMN05216191_103314 [Paenibacillus jilunlii]